MANLSINSNVTALSAQRNLSRTTLELSKTFQRLSSGKRINSAADDAAGLAVASSLKAQIRGLNQAERNVQDGIAMLQVAEGAISEISDAMQRMRELAVQAASDTVNDDERASIDLEFTALAVEIANILDSTEYNGTVLMGDGAGAAQANAFILQVGSNNGDTLTVTLGTIMNSAVNGVDLTSLDLSSQANAATAITDLDTAISGTATGASTTTATTLVVGNGESITGYQSAIGAAINRLELIASNLGSQRENMEIGYSNVMDADIASETTSLTRSAILQQAATAVLAQANQQPQLALQLLA
ncbi:MAG: flagellin FliC [Magnetococcus sp. WYHC-3]